MSITVARLVCNGYIVRTQNTNDARCVSLTLTTAGVRIKEQTTVLDPELMKEQRIAMIALVAEKISWIK